LIYFDQQLQLTHARPKHALHASMKVSFSRNHVWRNLFGTEPEERVKVAISGQ